MLYYGSEYAEELMQRQDSHPRYAGLGRKVMSHYLGHKYNPHEHYYIELWIRCFIRHKVELKVIDREPYDWPVIDNFLRYFFSECGYQMPYDMDVINRGYNGVIRGDLSEYHA